MLFRSKGERVPGIEKDPLLSAETDIVMEYNMLPGYIKKETSTFGEDKIRVALHEGGKNTVKKAVNLFSRKIKKAGEDSAHRK